MVKTYNGQDPQKRIGNYGEIYDIPLYLLDRYGVTSTHIVEKELKMARFTINIGTERNNCSPTAITRILKYYYDQGFTRIDNDPQDIYQKLIKLALGNGISERWGTNPFCISQIIRKILTAYHYPNSIVKGIYIWNFESTVIKEINAGRPLVMNITLGSYRNHTVTVNGYQIVQATKKITRNGKPKIQHSEHRFIAVYDGWKAGQRYIDYDRFAWHIGAGLGSFNTIEIKE